MAHADEDGFAATEGGGVLRAPPVEVVAAFTPVAAVPLADDRGHSSVRFGLILPTERQLPADLRFEFDVAHPSTSGLEVQCAPGTGGKSRSVEKDAGIVDEPGPRVAAVEFTHDAVLAFSVELPHLRRELTGHCFGTTGIVVISEVGTVGAAPLHEFRGGFRQHPLASRAEDAVPPTGQERHVEEPGAFLLGIVKADPFVGIVGSVRGGGGHPRMMAVMSADREDVPVVLTITPEARSTVLGVLAQEAESDTLALWLEVSGQDGGAYTYDMYFQALSDAADGDVVQPGDELTVVVPSDSVDRLQGARLDFVTDAAGESGLVIVNPNTPPVPSIPGLASLPEVDLSDPFAQRVVDVLEQQVNPSIASHGGRADLVAVADASVYLRLSGGCQGCGMAKATLSQGIEVILREAIPELVDVVDVTDHADGSNPYYQPA